MRSLVLRPNTTKGQNSSIVTEHHQKMKVLNTNPLDEAIDLILKKQEDRVPIVLDKLRRAIKEHRTRKRFSLLNSWYAEVGKMVATLKSSSLSEKAQNYLRFIEKSLTAALASNRAEPLERWDIVVARKYDQW